MAKELPYFKFEPNQWDNGNIQMCSREHKGLFIDLCSMYWSRLGDLPIKLAVQKLCAGNATALNSLCDDKIIAMENEFIRIDFLEEQLSEFESTRKQNSKNAKDGWEKRRKIKASSDRNATASIPQCENDAIREDKRREEKIIEEKKKEKPVAKSEAFDLEFINPDFLEIFSKWIQYKKERKQNYKSQLSLESAYKLLLKCSNNDQKTAVEVVEQSIGNNWAGLFELKQQFSRQATSPQYSNEDIWGQQQ